MASRDLLRSLASPEYHTHARSDLFEPRHLRGVENLDTVFLENFLDLGRDVGVLAQNQAQIAVDDGHPGAEAPEHLAELKADIAASEDDEVPGQFGQLHDARGIEEGNAVQAFDGRHRGPATGVDYDSLALKLSRAAPP